MKRAGPKFESEAALCAAFIADLPAGWTAYPETGGFDILLVRAEDGFQIGVEAKLVLNAKVVEQAAEKLGPRVVNNPGPDCRAVLVPYGASDSLSGVCRLLGVTVIQIRHAKGRYDWAFGSGRLFMPDLPSLERKPWSESGWFERAPASRCDVPGYVPDVVAGASAPAALTKWKIGAIKIAVLLERRGYVTRADFGWVEISASRWMQGPYSWLQPGAVKGQWIARDVPDFRAQHPRNYEEIAADIAKWAPPGFKDGIAPAPAAPPADLFEREGA